MVGSWLYQEQNQDVHPLSFLRRQRQPHVYHNHAVLDSYKGTDLGNSQGQIRIDISFTQFFHYVTHALRFAHCGIIPPIHSSGSASTFFE